MILELEGLTERMPMLLGCQKCLSFKHPHFSFTVEAGDRNRSLFLVITDVALMNKTSPKSRPRNVKSELFLNVLSDDGIFSQSVID